MATTAAGDHRLSTRQMAEFVANGFLRFDAIVPADINERAIDEIGQLNAERLLPDGMKPPHSRTPLDECYPLPSAIGEYLRLPQIRGIIDSLVGADPVFDHDWVHHIPGGGTYVQPLHVDASDRLDRPHVRRPAVLVSAARSLPARVAPVSFPAATSPASDRPGCIGTNTSSASNRWRAMPAVSSSSTTASGTPASRIPATTTGGCTRSASTRPSLRSASGTPTDFTDVQSPPTDHIFARMQPGSVAEIFRTWHPWMGITDYRNDQIQRALLWRYLTGDDDFDVDYYLTRLEGRADLVEGRA